MNRITKRMEIYERENVDKLIRLKIIMLKIKSSYNNALFNSMFYLDRYENGDFSKLSTDTYIRSSSKGIMKELKIYRKMFKDFRIDKTSDHEFDIDVGIGCLDSLLGDYIGTFGDFLFGLERD